MFGHRHRRRTYAILGLLAENGDASVRVVSLVLHYNFQDALTELVLLEKQGRVVSELAGRMDGTPLVRFYRLPTEAERKARVKQ